MKGLWSHNPHLWKKREISRFIPSASSCSRLIAKWPGGSNVFKWNVFGHIMLTSGRKEKSPVSLMRKLGGCSTQSSSKISRTVSKCLHWQFGYNSFYFHTKFLQHVMLFSVKTQLSLQENFSNKKMILIFLYTVYCAWVCEIEGISAK